MDDGYESPEINLASISGHHGNNIIRVSENECMWFQDRYDGICVSNRPLKKGDNYEVAMRGTGHLRLGLTSDLPCKKTIEEGLELSASLGNWYHIRMKEETEKITVEYLDKKIWIYTSHGGRQSHQGFSVPDKTKHFIIVNALFGELDIELTPKDLKKMKKNVETLKWCRTCGLNVLIQDNQTRFNLRYVNPLGVCALEQPLETGKGFSVKVLEVFGSWNYFCLGLSNEAPEAVLLDNWRICFDAKETTPWPKNVVHLLKVKYPKPETMMYFLWRGGNSILFEGGNGEVKEKKFYGVDTDLPIYVYLEPFRQRIQIDSRNNILEESSVTTYLTTTSCDPFHSVNQQFSSQSKLFQLDSPINNDLDQTAVKQIESPLCSFTDSELFGPPAFNLGSSDLFERRPDPQEHTLDSSHWSIDPQEHGASGHSDPLDIKSASLFRGTGPREQGAGILHRYSDPVTSKIFEQNQKPQETTSSFYPLDPEGSRGQSLPKTHNNWPQKGSSPPQLTPTASSQPLDMENRVQLPPPPVTDDQNINLKVSNRGVDKTMDNVSKCNMVLEFIKKDNSSQTYSGMTSELSNHQQNKCDQCKNAEKMAQSPDNSGARNPKTEIPEDNKLDNQISKETNCLKNLVRSATVPNHIRKMTERSSNPNHHLRSHSEQRVSNHQSNKNGHLTTSQVRNVLDQTKTGAIPKHGREISADLSKHGSIEHVKTGHGNEQNFPSINRREETISTKPKNPENLATPSWEKDEEKWRNCLQKNFTFFIEQVEPMHLCDKLYENKCLSEIEYENITKEQPRNRQCRELIMILKRKYHCKNDILCCLDLTEHRHIAERLRSCYDSC